MTPFGSMRTMPGWAGPDRYTKATACQRTTCGLRYVVIFDAYTGAVVSGVVQHGRLVRRQ